MAIIRWNPVTLTPVRDLFGNQDEVSRLLDGFFTKSPLLGDTAAAFTPAVDIEETADEFVVRADLPGVPQKDVKVSLMGDVLTIRGERKQESDRNDGGRHRVERVYGSFERSFRLGTRVSNDKVKAQYRDGVLEIHVPKAEEAKVREIEVQAAS